MTVSETLRPLSSVGSWAWAEQTGGRLRRRDRAVLMRQAVAARLELLPRPWREAILPTARLELPDPPDSALARAADERVLMLSEPVLYSHCLRTWAFATLFAQRDKIAYDAEQLYLSCVLHDLGLCTHHDSRDPTAGCFAVEGARAALVFLRSHDMAEKKARAIAENISLHLNVTVPFSCGAEAALLSKGAALDAVGRYAHQLSRSDTSGVLQQWPRDGFADFLAGAATRQARARPGSRSEFFDGFGFSKLVRSNQLDKPAQPVAASPSTE